MDEQFEARVALRISKEVRGQWALPVDENVSVGRLPTAGLHVGDSWVPSRLCRFIPFERGWVLQLGRPRALVANKYLGQHTFRGRAAVALQPGTSIIHFPELDDELYLRVTIGAGQAEGLTVLHDLPAQREGTYDRTSGRYAIDQVVLTDNQRLVLAVTYRHLLVRAATPDNVAKAAAQALGKSEQAVKNTLTDVRRKVNRERWLHLQDTEHLGQYLCRLTHTITMADLPEQFR
ncbi:hypothetical protein [Nocardioides yefusunii]|uniref:Uncharacterized protein n=1 Tax=Nocardioides yefusunii TaxID=2500546 RepID=A0ABW1QZ56_9ACTN|nr:hypothetical protein [Nocardioides yefusunii]